MKTRYLLMKNAIFRTAIVVICAHFAGTADAQSKQTSVLQSAVLDSCYQWARENYPLIKQLDLIDRSAAYSVNNAATGNLPQIGINAQATYQSDVTQFPIRLPNIDVPSISKDQYKVYAEVYQPLSNFATVNTKKKELELQANIDQQKIEIDVYQLKDRVNQLFFGTILIESNIKQLLITLVNVDSAMSVLTAAMANGTATKTDQMLLQVEQLTLLQKMDELTSNKKAFIKMLSLLTGKNIQQSTTFILPKYEPTPLSIERPELSLFKLQNQSLMLQSKQLNNRLLPTAGLFIQAGYGRPALNFLDNDPSAYYIGGLKVGWNISNLYSYHNSKSALQLMSQQLEYQEETFLLYTSLSQSQQDSEMAKYEKVLESDEEIIRLRESVLEAAKVQLANGLITTIDYVKMLNALRTAREQYGLHQIQLLQSQANLKTTTGN
ncbi:MAG: outer membrane protein TolC [Bacteroidia bacterium]|jgi:outer membrane protein TolC